MPGGIGSNETFIQENKIMKIVRSQQDFDLLKPKFPRPNDYRNFTQAGYYFDPNGVLEKGTLSIQDALPKAKPSGPRWRTFEAMESGITVEGFNQKAKEMRLGAEWDADIFIAVHRGFRRLIAQGQGTGMGK
ncbi:MAG: hypothetical protein CMM52_08125 [Rhodospirillaceae bacterium]|nr:hypothetical protein [Rhodospirillaceae bacterium]|tara:strand:- start:93 stop:488 length:396 start_codon:yes stop_codon:yes gene_type:complete